MNGQLIKNKIEQLPNDLKKEALDFIEFLIVKHHQEIKKEKLKFDWEGELKGLNKKHTSVELQHKAAEWR